MTIEMRGLFTIKIPILYSNHNHELKGFERIEAALRHVSRRKYNRAHLKIEKKKIFQPIVRYEGIHG